METQIVYFVRHAQANGQEPEAGLTEKGKTDSDRMQTTFKNIPIEQIISSPYSRAIDTIRPIATANQIEIIKDMRLAERVLSTTPLEDWLTPLKHSFQDLDLKLNGGESAKEAITRIRSVLSEVIDSGKHTILVTHGNLLALLIHSYHQNFGFREWKTMKNPDLFQLIVSEQKIMRKRAYD